MRITYQNTSKIKKFILSTIDKTVDKTNFIIDKKTKKRILTKDGEEVRFDEFAGIRKGSEIIIKSDIGALAKYVETYYH